MIVPLGVIVDESDFVERLWVGRELIAKLLQLLQRLVFTSHSAVQSGQRNAVVEGAGLQFDRTLIGLLCLCETCQRLQGIAVGSVGVGAFRRELSRLRAGGQCLPSPAQIS